MLFRSWNYNWYAQPLSPIESDGTYYAAGFGTDLPNALVLRVIDANNIGLNEAQMVEGKAYPNPANDNVTLSVEGEGVATVTVSDISGKIVSVSNVTLNNGAADYSVQGLTEGMYIFHVALENGKTAQFNVVKK